MGSDETAERNAEPAGQPVAVESAHGHMRYWLIGAGAIVIAAAAAVVGYALGHSSSHSDAVVQIHSTPARHHHKVITTTPTTTGNAISIATAPAVSSSIAIEQSDLPKGFVSTGTGTSAGSAGSALPADVCTPVSSKPWVGFTSASYGSTFLNQGVTASVYIMPTPQMAQAAVSAVLAPSFGSGCLQPSFDAYVRRNAYGVGEPASCGALVFTGSTIERLESPPIGWRYAGTLHCRELSDVYVSTSYRDTLLVSHGPIVMEIDFSSSAPPLTTELNLLSVMEKRADAYGTGPVTGQTP